MEGVREGETRVRRKSLKKNLIEKGRGRLRRGGGQISAGLRGGRSAKEGGKTREKDKELIRGERVKLKEAGTSEGAAGQKSILKIAFKNNPLGLDLMR